MLFGEWDMDTALAVREREGEEKGRVETKKEGARNLLALGVSPATVAQALSLDMETIKGLAAE